MIKRPTNKFHIILLVAIPIAIVIAFIGCFLLFLKPMPLKEQKISNGQFMIVTQIEETDNMEFISFYVKDIEGNIIYSCSENWRCWDFKEIKFIDDTNDIYVYSADTGTIIYKYIDDNTWDGSTGNSSLCSQEKDC